MAIRNNILGGSDYTDGEVLYDYDLDDTNNAILEVMSKKISLAPQDNSGLSGMAINNLNSVYYIDNTSSATAGSYVDFDVFVKAGTYTLNIGYERGTNKGIAELTVNGNSITTVDMYNASVSDTYTSTSGLTIGTSGFQTVRLVMSNKNASSTAYDCKIYFLSLIKTA